jgi:hypothetical protein
MGQRSSDDTISRDYYREQHTAINELAVELSYDSEIDLIAAAIRSGQNATAIDQLQKLKDDLNGVVAGICSLLHRRVNADHEKSDEIIMLKCRVIEGARAYAALNGGAQGVALMEGHLDSMDRIISMSIAGLNSN